MNVRQADRAFLVRDFSEDLQVQLSSATVEFVFAPEERDIYSYERMPNDLAPLEAKPGSETFTGAGKSDCAPTELRSKERTARL
jgi:hypothetical protein